MLSVSSAESQRAGSYLEVTFGELDSLVSNHLFVDVGTSECFVCNGSARVVIR
jgi:hypothetical protein